jgi:hypothetical protein
MLLNIHIEESLRIRNKKIYRSGPLMPCFVRITVIFYFFKCH